jgi:hypothetical protein
MNQGRIQMVFDVLLTTDYENRWEGKPIYFFLREVLNKYIYRPVTEADHEQVKNDFNQLYTLIRSYLNLNRY